MAAAGTPVVELTIGEHDIRTDPSILAAMHRSAMGGHTGYAMVPGIDTLRDTVAARGADRTGVATTRDNVIITPGGQAALFMAHMVACDAGDTALYLDPYYATYPGTLRGAGLRPLAVPCHAADEFQPRTADLATVAKGARSLLINTPNNPTGVVYTRSTLEEIAEVCQTHDLWLISDEVYETQVWQGTHISPRALPDMAKRTLVVGSMSKSHAMTGSRVGWLVGPKAVIAACIDLATSTTYGVPGFIQDAAVFALSQGPKLEQQINAPFQHRRALAADILARQQAVRLVPSTGAMYLMLDIRATGLSGNAFAGALLDTHQIAVMPGESFGEAAHGHLRVAMTVEDAVFAWALQTICDFARTKAHAKNLFR